jgi:hypothetical protein
VIVVVGSRHDRVATELVAAWKATLCSAEDLVSPGWVWPPRGGGRIWRAGGACVDDRDVSGVFVRRSAVYAEELTAIHPDDRAYVAAESHAFLSLVLATTAARVCNPVVGGAFGDEALGLDRLVPAAATRGVAIRPLRLSSESRARPQPSTRMVEVVGDRTFGDAPARDHDAARAVAAQLAVSWVAFAFDSRHRVAAARASATPSNRALAALRRLLEGDR